MNNLTDKRVFDSIEEINERYRVSLKIPDSIPESCNIVCYKVEGVYGVKPYDYYQENGNSLCYYSNGCLGWLESGNTTLEQEVADDIENDYLDLIYLRLATKDRFTPDCLLGVETTQGFVTAVYEYEHNEDGFVFDLDEVGQYCPSAFRYYISDENDETVSFDEYVDLFYER